MTKLAMKGDSTFESGEGSKEVVVHEQRLEKNRKRLNHALASYTIN